MLEPYPQIYRLSTAGQYDDAIGLLFDAHTQTLHSDFAANANHSWYLLGDLYFKSQRYSDALEAFQHALAAREDDMAAVLAIINTHHALGEPQKTISRFAKLIKRCKDHDVIYNYANALFDLGRYAEASALYSKIPYANKHLYRLAHNNLKLAKAKLSRQQS